MAVRKRPSSVKNIDDFIEGKKLQNKNKKEDKHILSLRLPSKLYAQMAEAIEGMPVSISINQWVTQAILEKVKNDTKMVS